MSSGRAIDSSVWPSTNSPGWRMNGSSPDDLDQLGETVHRLPHVDVRIARVVEHAELAVHPHVDAGGLDEPLVVGVDHDPPGGDLGLDRAVAENHGAGSLARGERT